MTIFFRKLAIIDHNSLDIIIDSFYDDVIFLSKEWINWLTKYLELVIPMRSVKMNSINPKYVLRNWMTQLAIDKAEDGDFSLVSELHELLQSPYDEQLENESIWFVKRPEWAENRVGCSMLSCSS